MLEPKTGKFISPGQKWYFVATARHTSLGFYLVFFQTKKDKGLRKRYDTAVLHLLDLL